MFHERLYQLRKSKGISQEELANVVGVSRQAVQKWESGASRPDMDNLTAIAEFFQVSLDYLIRGVEPAAPQASSEVHTTIINHYYPGWSYEYTSRRTLWGLPLVHVNLGRGFRRAKGILAIGNVATGVLAVGGVALGPFSVGCVSIGLLALGAACLGLIAAGAAAVGVLALGALSMGVLALGAVAKGMFAVGTVAVGSQVAIGTVASAPLAIGDEVEGAVQFLLSDPALTRSAVRAALEQSLSGAPRFLIDLLTFLAAHVHPTPLP